MMRFPGIRSLRRYAFAGVAAFVLAAPHVQAQSYWTTILSPEVSGATGTGSASFLLDGTKLTIKADWSGLNGQTTVAHIHCCTATAGVGTIGVAVTPGTLPGFPVDVTSGEYEFVVDLSLATSFTEAFVIFLGGGTLAGAQAALHSGFDNGFAYFNIHTSNFPAGEIRGFLTPADIPADIPEPSSVLLLAAGLLGLTVPAARRRTSRSQDHDARS